MNVIEKAVRIAELVEIRKKADAELDSLIQGTPIKRTWSRRPKGEQDARQGEAGTGGGHTSNN